MLDGFAGGWWLGVQRRSARVPVPLWHLAAPPCADSESLDQKTVQVQYNYFSLCPALPGKEALSRESICRAIYLEANVYYRFCIRLQLAFARPICLVSLQREDRLAALSFCLLQNVGFVTTLEFTFDLFSLDTPKPSSFLCIPRILP